jgi:ABC-type branched-subunit amino acid transport system substrate-binding protein
VSRSSVTRARRHRRAAAALSVVLLAFLASACGSRLTGTQAQLAQGANSSHSGGNASGNTGTGTGAQALGASDSGCSSSSPSSSSTTTTTTAAAAKSASTSKTKSTPTTTTTASTTTTTAPCSSTALASAGTGGAAGGGAAGGGGSSPTAHTGTAAASTGAAAGAAGAAPAAAGAGACGANGNAMPSGGNGGATATGVTANTIEVGNIASISGVVPGLTQSAQQATEAWADYVNSTGGICGRQIKVQPFDDGSDSGTDYADAEQACSADFAMVGNASGFDDGSAQAVSACGIPDMAAEISTVAAGTTADIFGASPGNAHYWSLGPANYLKATYPNAITKAAMIYLDVSATQTQATNEVDAYKSVGFNYVYDASTTPTNANYATNVQAMQSAGAQYVTEYSDSSSAERLLQAMQQANYSPQVVDWFSEEYSPQFAQQTEPESNGDLVLMSATAAYEEASANPGLQLMESWMNRVAPGYHQDIFAILAWSAGLAFEQAAKAVGPDLTRAALISQLQQITNWTGDGVTPPVNIGQKIPSKCFFYMKIENGAFQRVYPSAPNTYDCNSGYFQY